MDGLEEEFRKLLVETNDKYKHQQVMNQELRSENKELKAALQLSIHKGKEQEELIRDMNSTLILARNEIKELKNSTDIEEKEKKIHAQEEKISQLQEDGINRQVQLQRFEDRNSSLLREIEQYERELSEMKRENYNLVLKVEEQRDIVVRIEEKFKRLESSNLGEYMVLEKKYADLENDAKVKSAVLQDKCIEIEKLKTEISAKSSDIERVKSNNKSHLRNYEDKISILQDDLEKVEGKLKKSSQLLDEYEQHIQQLENGNRELTSANEKIKHSVQEKSELLEDASNKIANLKNAFRDIKSEKLKLEQTLAEEKKSHQEQLQEASARIQDLEGALGEIEAVYQEKIEQLELSEKELRDDNKIKEQEIRVLLVDREQQKKEFKEQVEKLQNFFK